MKQLEWKVIHQTDFKNEIDFLETVLEQNGIKEEDIPRFLNPTKKEVLDPLGLRNMDKAINLIHSMLNGKFLIKVDCDVDGYMSAAILGDFLKKLNPQITITYEMGKEKEHGLKFEYMSKYSKDMFDCIIVPDASLTCQDAILYKENIGIPILILDHHIIEVEYQDKDTGKWISKTEADELKENGHEIIEDVYTNYCLTVNCHDGQYKNDNLCGAGVVYKFIEAFAKTYPHLVQDIDLNYLDMVSLALIADDMDLRSLESRYYTLEGLKAENHKNELINEMVNLMPEEFTLGRTIMNMGWKIAPLINGVVRYGTEVERYDLFRAALGEQEDRPYQPRRKHKEDPKPPVQIYTLQKDMARISKSVKTKQDTEVRNFVKKIDEVIEEKNLLSNSVLFINGTDILTKNTVTGLVANKLTAKYLRPVVLLKERNSQEFGGSCRGYDKGNISNIKDFLTDCGMTVMGHANAAGVQVKKSDLPQIIKTCNEKLPLDSLCTIHTVGWEIPATQLKQKYIDEVANNYQIWGNGVDEPVFAITGLRIKANKIFGSGNNNNFISFVYNDIFFIKKYCAASEYDNMTLRDRHVLGINKKDLELNIIGKFVVDIKDDVVTSQVKSLYYDSKEITNEEMMEEKDINPNNLNKLNKNITEDDLDDDDFVF